MKAQLKKATLPNNKEVFCLRKEEVQTVYEQVQGYFKHDITIDSGDIIFDVGANIGLFSLQVSDLYEDIHIYAFEPVPAIFAALKQNTAEIDQQKLKVFLMVFLINQE